MTGSMAWTFPGGRFEQSVTSVTLVNATGKIVDTVVPAGKLWILVSIKAKNSDDVARVITLYIYKEAAKTNLLRVLQNASVNASALLHYPAGAGVDAEEQTNPYPILAAGNAISVQWTTGGASTGGTAADGLVIEYLEVSVSA